MSEASEREARALFDRALFQAFPGRMTHVRDKENADMLWSKMRGLLAFVWADAYDAEPPNPYRTTPPAPTQVHESSDERGGA